MSEGRTLTLLWSRLVVLLALQGVCGVVVMVHFYSSITAESHSSRSSQQHKYVAAAESEVLLLVVPTYTHGTQTHIRSNNLVQSSLS